METLYNTHTNESLKIVSMYEVESLIYGDTNPYSNDGMKLLKKFLEEHNGMHYGAPKEDFSRLYATRKALELGFDLLILDDLS